jgi:hypothetical protein
MADDETSALPGQPLMAAVARYAGGEPLRLASVVFWNITQAGLRSRLSALVRRPARTADNATGDAPVGRFTCDVGVIAVGERRVFRLRLGNAPMIGASAGEATLPAALLAAFPREFFADQIATIRPLSVAVHGDRLYIRALGRGQFDLAMRTVGWYGGNLAVGAETIAAAVRTLAAWPAPEDAIAAIVTAPDAAPDPSLAGALADRDYAEAFVGACERQPPDVRRALILAAHAGPKSLQSLVDRSIRAGALAPRTIFATAAFCALLILGGGAATVFLGSGLVTAAPDAHGRLSILASFNKFGLIAAVSIFGFASIIAGIALVMRGWRYIDARGAERRLFTHGDRLGDALGGRRDGLLALAALRGPTLAPPEWREVEATATADPAFADRLCAAVLAMPAAEGDAFLAAAPAALKAFLIRALLARKSVAHAPAAQIAVTAWIACLVAGVIGAVTEPPQAAMSTTDWLLLLAGAGALPAILLAVAQARRWLLRRRLMRRL